MMKNSLILVVIVTLLIGGCASTIEQAPEDTEDSGIYIVMMFAKVVTKLLLVNLDATVKATLQDLEDTYGVQVVKPTEDFWNASKAYSKALNELQKAMNAQGRSLDEYHIYQRQVE